MKITTRCHILKLKCTKFDFGWGSAPDPAGELTALHQTPYLDLRGYTSNGKLGRSLRASIEGRGKGNARAGETAVVDLEPDPPQLLWATNCMHDAITHGTHDM